MSKSSREQTYLILLVVYTVVFGSMAISLRYWFDSGSILTNMFYANLLGSVVILLACVHFNTFNINDPYWSSQSIFNSIYLIVSCTRGRVLEPRALVVYVLVNFWAVRLLSTLLMNSVHEIRDEDWRYNQFRSKWSNPLVYFVMGYLSFMLVPTIVVYFGCVPMYYAFMTERDLNLIDLLATGITVLAIYFEAVGDYQLRQVRLDTTNSDTLPCMDKGLWSLCRHPNYFGEITFWFGLYAFGLATDFNLLLKDTFYLLTLALGAGGVFVIIYFGSMPMMEERQLKRRGPFYSDYMRRVPFKILPLGFLTSSRKSNKKTK